MFSLTKVEELMTLVYESNDFILYKVEDEENTSLVLPNSTEE